MTGENNKPIIIHVHPDNDEHEHVIDRSMKCWCEPTLLHLGTSGIRVSHHSADGREFVEKELGELLDNDKTWAITET